MRTIFLFIAIVSAGLLRSQEIKLKEATALHWADGPCCNSGVNYTFIYEAGSEDVLKVDTVWIGQWMCVPDGKQCIVTSEKGLTKIFIPVSNNYNNQKFTEEITPLDVKAVKCPVYKGEAMIIAHNNEKRKVYVIKTISQVYELARP